MRAVLEDAALEGAHALLSLGDLVGYGAEPAACVDAVAERAVAMVGGNHEHGAAGLLSLDWFNPEARQLVQDLMRRDNALVRHDVWALAERTGLA